MRIPKEKKEQKDFVAWFKKNHPSVKIMMIRNDGYRTPREKVEQKEMGLLSGAADLYIPEWHLWIEMKRIKGSRLSEEQANFRDYVRNECGDNWMMPKGCEDAIQLIQWFIDGRPELIKK